MPTYTYACTDCDEQLEVVQTFTADPLTECPRCGGRLRKVFHPVGVVFKGSGFYRTDSRSTGKAAKGGSGTSGSSSKDDTSGKGAAASSDSGPSSGSSASSTTKPSTPSSGSGSSGGSSTSTTSSAPASSG